MRAALYDTVTKLTNESTLPRRQFTKYRLPASPEAQWILEMILRWRTYLSKNLDFKQEEILPSNQLAMLAHNIHGIEAITVQELAGLLQQHGVPDKLFHSAKLLLAYLDKSGQSLIKMTGVICRACNQTGHVVSTNNKNIYQNFFTDSWVVMYPVCVMCPVFFFKAKFCFVEKDSTLHKDYVNRRENFNEKVRQYQRRREHYCINRGYDPATYTCPWESEPGVPMKKE